MWRFRGNNGKSLLREIQRMNQVEAKVLYKRCYSGTLV